MNGLSAMNASGGGGGERLAPNTQAGESRASEPWQAGQGGDLEAGKISQDNACIERYVTLHGALYEA